MNQLYLLYVAIYFIANINTIDGCPEECLPTSCKDWYNLGIRKSCHYPIYPNGKTSQLVYCDMDGTSCDGKGGWTRVAYLNMTESNPTCPTGLTEKQYNNISHAVCGRPTSSSAGCSSTTFSTHGMKYFKVCGQIRGYAYQAPDAFSGLYRGINKNYVDGVSITHGVKPRKHIWTYAGGLKEDETNNDACPCNTGYKGSPNPSTSFVGNNYYCESALDPGKHWTPVLYASDPLWDGMKCDSKEASCCTNPKMPWFSTVLDDITQNDIELRMCDDQGSSDEGTPLDIIELYIR